jgi:hypothetical protein
MQRISLSEQLLQPSLVQRLVGANRDANRTSDESAEP